MKPTERKQTPSQLLAKVAKNLAEKDNDPALAKMAEQLLQGFKSKPKK